MSPKTYFILLRLSQFPQGTVKEHKGSYWQLKNSQSFERQYTEPARIGKGNFWKKIYLFFNLLNIHCIFFTVYLWKSALFVHQSEAVHWFLCQSVHNFLVVDKSDRAPIQTLAAILSLDHN